MTIRTVCCSMAVKGCLSYTHLYSALAPSSIAKAGGSVVRHFCTDLKTIDDRGAGKSLRETNWRKREIKILNPPHLETKQRKDLSLRRENVPLTFEAYKKTHLQTFGEFQDELKEFYNIDELRFGYECYCKGSYNSYLIELEQENPGIIL